MRDIRLLTRARWQGMENEKGVFCMNYQGHIPLRERWLEEKRKKKECEPYEEIIRRLRKLDQEKAKLEQSPTARKS